MKFTLELASSNDKTLQPNGSGAALQSQLEQQKAMVEVKIEQAAEISDLKGKVEEEKKISAAHKLNFERMKECVICMDEDKSVVLFPCSHLALCVGCSNFFDACPICREKIEEKRTIKVA